MYFLLRFVVEAFIFCLWDTSLGKLLFSACEIMINICMYNIFTLNNFSAATNSQIQLLSTLMHFTMVTMC